MIIYIDMVADLFHYGHSNALRQIYEKYVILSNKKNKLYVGIHNDKTVESYKRKPIMTMNERISVLQSCKYIDLIIPNAPLSISKDYIDKHNIDLICIPDNKTTYEIELMYAYPYKLGIIRKIKYTSTISTSSIIKRIKKR